MGRLIFNYCIITLFFRMTIDAESTSIFSNTQPIRSSIRIKRQFGFPSQSFSRQRPINNAGFGNFPGDNAIFFDDNNVFNDFVVPTNGKNNQFSTTPRQNSNLIAATPSQNNNQFTSTSRPTSGSGTTVAIPGMGTTSSACEDRCSTTQQYNPVCGSNNVTYINKARFDCAVRCGRRIRIASNKACPRV
ncbi:unnamed protein product [Ceutorhynchus assimilis]|uniref:Kazal-like domain-containing protein n=1 Tax=Ceutorhynchus assimilis TaxID=467358 RepID=A0A9N9MRA1_9CUCU|nr:unnamed protein product [Ceutorhynchus assimilis]